MSDATIRDGEVWELRLLGGMDARWGGAGRKTIDRFRSQKAASLLAYLALHPDRAHPREELADLFWPDADDVEAARANLRQALATMRRDLEGEDAAPTGAVIQADGRAFVRLNPDAIRTDVARFEATFARAAQSSDPLPLLEEVIALYAGPLLPGNTEPWAAQARARLAETYLTALERLSALRAAQGDLSGALQVARRAIAADPLRERAHATVVQLLRESEGEAAARRHYEEATRVLGEKLGVSPSAELRAALEGSSGVLPPLHPQAGTRPNNGGAREENSSGTLPVLSGTPIIGGISPTFPQPKQPTVRLPLTLTRFFGREDEVARIEALLGSESASPVRLVTLTGPGGSGKTRLAVEAARRLAASRFTGGVHFAALADLRDGTRVPEALLAALVGPSVNGSVSNPAGLPAVELAVAELATRPGPVLIVLDNAEHLIEEVGDAVLALLERTPQLSLIVTSRQNLNVIGEQELPVDPLPVPSLAGSPERLLEFPSVALFVHRAQQVRPDFPYTARTAPTIASLCALLDGIPLAIEIAASWVQTLTPTQMMERLCGRDAGEGRTGAVRLDALEWRRRDTPARHATLRAAIAWGFDLLPEDARRFFTRLSVFRGGWTMEAAESIAGKETVEPAALLLTELRDRSFVVAEEIVDNDDRTTMRYRMLETLREFADEQLSNAEREILHERHIAYFADVVSDLEQQIGGATPRTLDAELYNLRATLDRDSDPLRRLHVATGLRQFWADRGHLREGRERIESALEAAPPETSTALRATAHHAAGQLALSLLDFDGAQCHFDTARALYADAGEERRVASVMLTQGIARANRGDLDGARALYVEALEIARRQEDRALIGSLLARFGALEAQRGERATALPYLEEAIIVQREVGASPGSISGTLHNLGLVYAHLGDLPRGIALLEETVQTRREAGETLPLANSLQTLGALRIGLAETDSAAYDAARNDIEEALALYDRAGTRCLTPSPYINLGNIALQQSEDPHTAAPYLAQAVRLALERDRADSLMASLGTAGYVAAMLARAAGGATASRRRDAEQAAERAALLWGAALAQRNRGQITLSALEMRHDDHYAEMARAIIGDERFEAGRTQGATLPVTEAAEVALAVCADAVASAPTAKHVVTV